MLSDSYDQFHVTYRDLTSFKFVKPVFLWSFGILRNFGPSAKRLLTAMRVMVTLAVCGAVLGDSICGSRFKIDNCGLQFSNVACSSVR